MPRGKATGVKLRGLNASSCSVDNFCSIDGNGCQNVAAIALLAAWNNDSVATREAGAALSKVFTQQRYRRMVSACAELSDLYRDVAGSCCRG